jgi:hypothetical protein
MTPIHKTRFFFLVMTFPRDSTMGSRSSLPVVGHNPIRSLIWNVRGGKALNAAE